MQSPLFPSDITAVIVLQGEKSFQFFIIIFFPGYIARGDWLGSAWLETLRKCEWTNTVQGAVEPGCDSDRVLGEGISHSDHHWCCLHSKLQKYHSSESCRLKLVFRHCIVFEHLLVLYAL